MTPPHKGPKRNEKIDREIDRNLRRAFDDMAGEPVPERFTLLLNQLRQDGAGKSGGSDDEGTRGDD